MFNLKKLAFLASLFMVGMLLLAACGGEEPSPATVEEMAEEFDVTATTEPSSEKQIPKRASEVPRISVEELMERLDNGEEIVVVDTRSTTSYDIKHIPGAISMPSINIESPLDELPLDQEIVLYCT